MSKTTLFFVASLAVSSTCLVYATELPTKKKVVTPVRPAATGHAPSRVATRTAATRTPVRGRYIAARYHAPVTPPGPSPDRYKEIQQALAAKGYYNGEISGLWGSESVDALKRFQKDQNLNPDGKLSSVSLIALGLGPKRNLSAPANPAQQTAPAPPPITVESPSTQSGARL